MSKVKLVIEIDEELYHHTLNGHGLNPYGEIYRAIQNGTPLPEDFSLEDYERYKKDSESLSWIKCPEKMGN